MSCLECTSVCKKKGNFILEQCATLYVLICLLLTAQHHCLSTWISCPSCSLSPPLSPCRWAVKLMWTLQTVDTKIVGTTRKVAGTYKKFNMLTGNQSMQERRNKPGKSSVNWVSTRSKTLEGLNFLFPRSCSTEVVKVRKPALTGTATTHWLRETFFSTVVSDVPGNHRSRRRNQTKKSGVKRRVFQPQAMAVRVLS